MSENGLLYKAERKAATLLDKEEQEELMRLVRLRDCMENTLTEVRKGINRLMAKALFGGE